MQYDVTDHARNVVQIANQEAMRLRCNYIGPEHILVALITEQEGLAGRVLRSLGLTLEHITPVVEAVTERHASSPRMFDVIRAATEEAETQYHSEIDTEHLLLGLVRDDGSRAARILEGLGINCSRIRSELLARITPGSPATAALKRFIEERFRDDPQVRTLQERINDLHRELEKAVVAMNFDAAVSLRDRKLAAVQQLKETYARLHQESDSSPL